MYRLVTELQMKAIPVQQSCRLLALSRSGYYDARCRPAKLVLCKTRVHLKAAFIASHQSYGTRRCTDGEHEQVKSTRHQIYAYKCAYNDPPNT